ncbi:MAG: V-type ATPase subunit [Spirochaetia bacterium]
MFSAGKLSYESAKLKARLSHRLPQEKISALLKCKNIEEAVLHLQGTYYEVFYESYTKTGYLGMAELAIKKREIDALMSIRLGLSGQVRKFVVAMLSLYEIENLKGVLAVWLNANILGRRPLRVTVYLKEKILTDIPYEQVLAAKDFATIVELLKDTPYGPALRPYVDISKTNKTLFYFSVALDMFYYSHLKFAINGLKGADRLLASRFFGTQVDFENLRAQLRYKDYKIDFQSAQKYFLHGGSRVQENDISQIIQNSQNVRTFLQSTYGESVPKCATNVSLLREIEMYQRLEMDRMGRFMLTSNPLGIAPIIAYFYWMREEQDLVVSLLECVYYGLDEKETGAVTCLSLRK